MCPPTRLTWLKDNKTTEGDVSVVVDDSLVYSLNWNFKVAEHQKHAWATPRLISNEIVILLTVLKSGIKPSTI